MTDVFNAPATETIVPVTETVVPSAVIDKRLKDKDDYIARLEQEAADMRAEVKKAVDAATQLEVLRNELKSLKESRVTNQPRENTTPALTEVDIKTLVQKTINETEASKSTAQNIKDANDALVTNFGGDLQKAGEAVVKRAQELGLSVEFLRDVAAKSPTAFLEVMKQEPQARVSNDLTKSSVNTETLGRQNGVAPKEGTKAFFDNIKKSNPKEYWSPHIQQQIYLSAKRGTYLT